MSEIDLVLTWSDNNDPVWQETLRTVSCTENPSSHLFRDWGWLKYWLRGVEQNLPWIRSIYLVTSCHLPEWLNTEHPKLRIVKHKDYIPGEYLPTFSSHTIEWNMCRIDGLSEQFVYCNDDMFFLHPVREEDYFRGGLPCDVLHIRPVTESRSIHFHHLLLNNMTCLNRHFDMHACADSHAGHWFADQYTDDIRRDNAAALRWNRFPGLYYDHMPMPLLKSSVASVWEKEPELLDEICKRPLRGFYRDVNIYLARFMMLASGKFVPHLRSSGTYCLVSDPLEKLEGLICGDTPVICINDTGADIDFGSRKKAILDILESRFPEPSSFERIGLP